MFFYLIHLFSKCKLIINTRLQQSIMKRHKNSIPKQGMSLFDLHPDIASRWHPEKNGELKPSEIKPKSNKKRWWFCNKSTCEHPHEWEAPPDALFKSKERGHSGCPFCSKKKRCICNTLGTIHPEISLMWHPTLNSKTPFDFAPMSNTKVWWKCPNGPDHEWESAPSHLVMGTKCPFCSSPPKRISITNCMATIRPDMVQYWHEELNGKLTPYDVFAGSSTKKYWWKCPNGDDHVWQTNPDAIGSALSSDFTGIGCPFCAGLKVSKTNRLTDNYPKIANQWHPTLNGKRAPNEFTSGNDYKAWWKCDVAKDHIWQATIASRTSGTGCPACDGKQVSSTNSIAILHPHLINEWHPSKNGTSTVFDFAAMSGKKVWWKCKEADDHEWQAFIYTRAEGYGCPFCANRKGSGTTNAVSDTNRFSILYPEIAKEWHPTENGDLRPENFVFGSHTKVWWQCREHPEHVWKTKIYHRTQRGSGCPDCANYGINLSEPTFYYVMRIEGHDGIWWWKGGISVDPERRAKQIQRSLNSNGMLLEVLVHEVSEFKTGELALKFERQMLETQEIRESTVEIFSGSTELFNQNPLQYARSESLLDLDSLTSNQRV
jgi:hypothetical protein